MFETGQYYKMTLHGEEITFKVVIITSDGDVKGKLSNNVDYITFNVNRIYTSEINSIEKIN